jgi:hypothetical protein
MPLDVDVRGVRVSHDTLKEKKASKNEDIHLYT